MTSPEEAHQRRETRIGIILGLVSALGYTGTNLALRHVAVPEVVDSETQLHGGLAWSVWVTANKAIPAALVGWVLVAWRTRQGLPALPPRHLVLPLIVLAVIVQYGGNLAFQWALTLGGLAITVPLCFASLVVTGAWTGRIYLGDSLSPRTLMSLAVLMVSIGFLSIGAGDATTAMNPNSSTTTIVLAILVASLSGACYGVNGVVIRSLVRDRMSISASLVVFSTVGVVVLGIHSLFDPGIEMMLATTGRQWQMIILAGWLNAIAFFAIAGSLKRISVTFTNVLSASQNAMCAAAGVMLFAEPLTAPMVIGCALTIVGLLIVDN